MDPSVILVKTSSGMDAYKNRATSHIPPRARAILMLVDDRSSASQLVQRMAMFHDVQEHLQWLYQQGYIALAGQEHAVAPMSAPQQARAANEAAATPAMAGQALSLEMRQMLEQELIEFLGPMASLECEDTWPRCHNTADAVRLLAAKLDAAQAAQFMQRVGKRLGS